MIHKSEPVAQPLPSSFRDPSGYVFHRDGHLYRKVNPVYMKIYAKLVESGLYQSLTSSGSLISHEEVAGDLLGNDGGVVLQPKVVPFISYPYEWSFEQLKDAALLTLSIAEVAIRHNMVLKDASAYNIQFLDGSPVFIDTLSFDEYREGAPWVAYAQFCRHFLAPLWLAAHVDYRCMLISRDFIDGIPLDYACRMLGPMRRLDFTELVHLRIHAKLQQTKAGDRGESTRGKRMPKTALLGLLDNLKAGITKLEWKPGRTEWGEYYKNTNYSDEATLKKNSLIHDILGKQSPQVVWDIGANDGTYSRIAAEYSEQVVAMDIDPVAVNANYKKSKNEGETKLLPLLMDLTNPSMGLGWLCEERDSLFDRASADLVMALALVHHLCISNNVSFERLVQFFSDITLKYLLVEFVPKEDSKVGILLATREDVFSDYDLDGFKAAMDLSFELESEYQIDGSVRTLLLLKKRV